MAETLATWVSEVLGDHTVTQGLPVNDRKVGKGQRIRVIQDASGGRWVLKEVPVAAEWAAEVHAYQNWLGALEDRAPTLKDTDEVLQVLLMSAVSGEHPHAKDAGAHQRAGALLRRLHRAAPAREEPAPHRTRARQRIERLLVEASGVLTAPERSFLRVQADRFAALPTGIQVPCHGDYRQHNWLIDESGTLRVIDFGKSRWEVPAWDLCKLFLRPWWQRPRLAAAFLEGYGRLLRSDEARYIQHRLAIDALSQTAFGTTRGSDRHVQFGKSRIADLMAGHRVITSRLLDPGDG